MPEGHLLHRLARDQTELTGHVLAVTSPQGRFAAGAGNVLRAEGQLRGPACQPR